MLWIKDLDKDDYIPPQFHQAPVEEVFALKKEEEANKKKGDKSRKGRLAELGFEAEHSGEVLF
jgi:U6 snRNA-associated Sm-like protein LSm1